MARFHPESPELTDEALSRLRFMADFRKHLHLDLSRGNQAIYDLEMADQPAPAQATPAERRDRVREMMEQQPFFQGWSSLLRNSQDLMWDYVGRSVDASEDRMALRLKSLSNAAKGSLKLDPEVETPAYFVEADVHRMPGGYMRERPAETDMRAGGVYDLGGAVYQLGRGNVSGALLNDSRGRTLVAFLKSRYPKLEPKRILDMGCGVGNNTVPLALGFPQAETVGLDLGAPLLRYAHLRAEGLEAPIHFVQGDAEHTKFEAGSFDLVVSQIILHETSPEATQRIIAESRRLLRPGGVAVHLEVPLRAENGDDYYGFRMLWEEYYNAEPNIGGVMDQDLAGIMGQSGFKDVVFGYQTIPGPDGTGSTFSVKAGPNQWAHWLVLAGVAA